MEEYPFAATEPILSQLPWSALLSTSKEEEFISWAVDQDNLIEASEFLEAKN
jgi:hypothetical protein